jgi:hypothetical protein
MGTKCERRFWAGDSNQQWSLRTAMSYLCATPGRSRYGTKAWRVPLPVPRSSCEPSSPKAGLGPSADQLDGRLATMIRTIVS